jgi:hypothetical protein
MPRIALQLLAEPARRALQLHPGTSYSRLLPVDGPGDEARRILADLTAQNVLANPVRSQVDAACVLSALWLWHDDLHRSHEISQQIKTSSGSFWHAIMHRREGDFWNSKYWLDRCIDHPALPAIATTAAERINAHRHADPRLMQLTLGQWNPVAFVDLVEAATTGGEEAIVPVLVELQRIEWRGLFAHCLAGAAG